MKLVSVGEITLDHYLDQNQTHVGGISLNFAIHAKRSGASEVALVSRVGSEDGQIVLTKLEQETINSSYIQTLKGKTASIEIKVLEDGERIFPKGGYQENVLKDFRLSEKELAFLRGQDILVTLFDSKKDSHFGQLKELEFSGKRVVDFGDWSRRKHQLEALFWGLENLDLAFISGTEETIETLLPLANTKPIIVTLGAKGSKALLNGKAIFQEATKVQKIVDTTGCGDAFQAAFVVYYFQTKDIQGALKKAAEQAARVLQHYAAF